MNKGILLAILAALSSQIVSADEVFPCVTEDTMLRQIALLQEIRDQNALMLNLKQASNGIAKMYKNSVHSSELDPLDELDKKVMQDTPVPSYRPDFEGLADRINGL